MNEVIDSRNRAEISLNIYSLAIENKMARKAENKAVAEEREINAIRKVEDFNAFEKAKDSFTLTKKEA